MSADRDIPPEATREEARLDRRCAWVAGLVPLLLAACFHHAIPYDNALVRWIGARALVEQRTLTLDGFAENQQLRDKALVDGRSISDKAPGSSAMIAVLYAPLYAVGLVGEWARYLCRLCLVGGALSAMSLLLYRAARAPCVGCEPRQAAALALACSLGSHALPYSGLLYAHLIVAALGFAALLLAVPAAPGQRASPRALAAAGGLLGAAIATEYPAVLVAGAIGGFTLWRHRRGCWPMIAGALAPLLALLAYHQVAFGSPWATGYDFHFEPHLRSAMQPGIAGVTWPRWDAAVLILFSPSRGLLFVAPWLVLLPFAWRRLDSPRLRVGALTSALILLFNAAYSMPEGGWAAGPRHMLPALPMMALLIAPLLRERRWRPVLAGLGVVGALRNVVAAGIAVHVPPEIAAPLTGWWLPLAARGMAAGTPTSEPTWLALPLALMALAGLVLCWRAWDRRYAQAALLVMLCGAAAQLWTAPERPATALMRAEALDVHGKPEAALMEAEQVATQWPEYQPAWQMLSRLVGDQPEVVRELRALRRRLLKSRRLRSR